MTRLASFVPFLAVGMSSFACGGTTQLDAIGTARDGGTAPPSAAEAGPANPDAPINPAGSGLQFSNCPTSPDPNIEVVACGLPAEANLLSVEAGNGGAATYWMVHPKGVSSFAHGVNQPSAGTSGWQPESVIPEASLPSSNPRVLSRYVAKVAPGLLYAARGGAQSALVLWDQATGRRTELATSIEPLRVVCLSPSCSYTNGEDAQKHPEAQAHPTVSLIPYVYAGVTTASVTSSPSVSGEVLAVRGNQIVLGTVSVLDVFPQGFLYVTSSVGGPSEEKSHFVADPAWSLYDLTAESTSDENGAYVRVPAFSREDPAARTVLRIGFDGSYVGYPSTRNWADTRALVGSLYGRKEDYLLRTQVGSSSSTEVEELATGLQNMGPVASDGKDVFVTFDTGGSRVLGRIKQRAASQCGACVASGISWKWDGGMRAYYDASEVSGCRAYTYKRYPGGSEPDSQSCTQDLSDCESDWGSADLVMALAHPDVKAAFATKGSYSFGHDSRPMDGAMLMVAIGEASVLIGGPCQTYESACTPVPAGLVKLASVLTGIDASERARGQCKSTFPE